MKRRRRRGINMMKKNEKLKNEMNVKKQKNNLKKNF